MNYYDRPELSVSTYKRYIKCPRAARAVELGQWPADTGKALLIGSYVDCGLLEPEKFEDFKERHASEIFTKAGKLSADFVMADNMISAAKASPEFMCSLEGDKQTEIIKEINGVPFRSKLDVCNRERNIIVDLKTMKAPSEGGRPVDSEALRWHIKRQADAYNYALQGAVYRYMADMQDAEVYLSIIFKTKDNPRLVFCQLSEETMQAAFDEFLENVQQVSEWRQETDMLRLPACNEEHGRCLYCRANSEPTSIII